MKASASMEQKPAKQGGIRKHYSEKTRGQSVKKSSGG
jgi:hypothetical protein